MKAKEMEAILTGAVKAAKLESILLEKRDAYVSEATKGKFKSFNELKEAKGAANLKEAEDKRKAKVKAAAEDKLEAAKKAQAEAEAILKTAAPKAEVKKD